MEFENVNNFNLALEASKKKQKKLRFSTLVHRLKKLLRRAKPKCTQQPQTQEEYDNEQNERLEAKLYVVSSPDQDMKPFQYTTEYQVAQKQFLHNRYQQQRLLQQQQQQQYK